MPQLDNLQLHSSPNAFLSKPAQGSPSEAHLVVSPRSNPCSPPSYYTLMIQLVSCFIVPQSTNGRRHRCCFCCTCSGHGLRGYSVKFNGAAESQCYNREYKLPDESSKHALAPASSTSCFTASKSLVDGGQRPVCRPAHGKPLCVREVVPVETPS